MIKVIFDAQPFVKKMTGVGNYTFSLIEALGKLKQDKFLFSPFYFNFNKCFKSQIKLNCYKNIHLKEIDFLPGFLFHKLWKWSDSLPINLFIKDADIIHYPNFMVKPYKNARKVITVHDLAFERYPQTIEPGNLKWLKKNFRRGLSKSDAVITVSEFSRKEFQKYYPDYKGKVYVTHNGIKTDSLTFQKNLPSLFPDSEYILYLGTIEPRKNLKFILRGFKELLKLKKHLKLVVAGQKGWLTEDFYQMIDDLNIRNNVILPGYIAEDDLSSLYENASLFVFPSIYEGFGLPPLEAMAKGTPVWASDIPVLKEVLSDAAEFFSLDITPLRWAEKTNELLNNQTHLKAMQEKGYRQVKKFTWEKTATETLKVYEDILKK